MAALKFNYFLIKGIMFVNNRGASLIGGVSVSYDRFLLTYSLHAAESFLRS
jgi:hypothetical protein